MMSFANEANERQRKVFLGMLERSVSEGTVPAAEHEARKERIEEASRKAAALRAQADEVVMDQSAVACTQGNGGGLDRVEQSLQTLDDYLETLRKHLPFHAQCFHELGLESYKEFKKMLHRGEDALLRAYVPPAVPANPPASPIDDLIKAAVEEVMAESS